MTVEPRLCPRRGCDGNLYVTEEGTLNGVDVEYWDCSNPDCGYSVRETAVSHDEPKLL
jgi:hypothetical protein